MPAQQKEKGNDAGRKNSAYCSTLPTRDAVRFVLCLRVAWCVAGYLIHRQKAVAYTLQRYGHWIVPVVLIALGIYILLY
jgi:cadmium resistance protein CadD (predicted permease)